VLIKKSHGENNNEHRTNINNLLKKGYNLKTKGVPTTSETGIRSGIFTVSSSQPKSYWKTSSNIRINPKNLAPEYYQKYLNSTNNSTVNNNYSSSSNNNINHTERSQLFPKIKNEKRVNTILDKKKYSKNRYGNNNNDLIQINF